MDLHRLAEERSVAYHSVIAERLREHPEILENARRRVQGWLASSEGTRFYAQKWAEVLSGDVRDCSLATRMEGSSRRRTE
jgi:hypothetical protein